MALSKEQKDQIINDLINNEGLETDGPWVEGDREALNAIPETKLIALNQQREKMVEQNETILALNEAVNNSDEDSDDGDDSDDNTDDSDLSQNSEPMTVDQWMNTAPPEVRSAVTNAMRIEREQKEALIQKITANKSNVFKKDYLAKRSLEELQGIAALAANQASGEQQSHESGVLVSSYSGVPAPQQTNNRSKDFANEDLDMIPEPMGWDS